MQTLENHTIVTLKKGEGRTVKAGGLWIYDNEIDTITGRFHNGDLVTVHDFDGYPMAQRGEAGKAGVTDIAQKNGQLRFRLDGFDMEIVSALYAMPEYKGRLRVDGGSVPAVLLKLKARTKVIEQARAFIRDWQTVKDSLHRPPQTS